MRKLGYIVGSFCFAAFLMACNKTPDGVIPPHDMALLLADIHEGEGVVEIERGTFYNDSLKTQLLESIYSKHGVTAEMMDSSLSWYGRNIEKYEEVYDEVIEILDKRLADAKAVSVASSSDAARRQSKEIATLEGDSVDVWQDPRYHRFYSLAGTDFLNYKLSRDNNWDAGDVYTLNVKLVEPKHPVSLTVFADYTDGHYDYTTKEFSEAGWASVVLPLDKDRSASWVSVSINYPTKGDEVLYVDSISLIRERYAKKNKIPRPAGN